MDTTQPPEKNRGGRPKGAVNKATRDVRELAQQYTAEALTTLAAIMREGNNEQARIAAAKELLDRGHGKSTQPIDATVVTETYEARLARLMAQAEESNG